MSKSFWKFSDSFNSMQFTVFSQNIRHCWTMHFLFIRFKSFINDKISSIFEQTTLKRTFTKTLWKAKKRKLQWISKIKQNWNRYLFWFTMCSILWFDARFSISLSRCALCWSSQRNYDEKASLHFSIEDERYFKTAFTFRIKTRLCVDWKKNSLQMC